jgi:thiol-disulfide isomerase/thioredoxin
MKDIFAHADLLEKELADREDERAEAERLRQEAIDEAEFVFQLGEKAPHLMGCDERCLVDEVQRLKVLSDLHYQDALAIRSDLIRTREVLRKYVYAGFCTCYLFDLSDTCPRCEALGPALALLAEEDP